MELETLHEKYKHFFKHLQHDGTEKVLRKGRRGRVPYQKPDHIFFMAIDAEWYFENGRNNVLSYQIATCSEKKTKNIIKYMDHSKRLKLPEILEYGIRSVTTNDEFLAMKGKKVEVILISHNAIAEWSVLADRDKPYIIKRLRMVRKGLITYNLPIKAEIKGNFPVDVFLFDTMILAPAGHKSLAKLSTLTGSDMVKKVQISQHNIENMYEFLAKDPDKFKEYALMDSAVTLILFFLLQELLNELVKVYGDVQSRLFGMTGKHVGKRFLVRARLYHKQRKYRLERVQVYTDGSGGALRMHTDKVHARNRAFILNRAINRDRTIIRSRRLTNKQEKSSHTFKLYKTLASAGVESFSNQVAVLDIDFSEYRRAIRYLFRDKYDFIKRCYYGGRNEAYFIGKTSNYPETKDKLWIDIDFIGCYPTAMNLCPLFDLTKKIDYIPFQHRIDDNIATKLINESKIPEDIVNAVRDALSRSPAAFDEALDGIKKKSHKKIIRQATRAYDNRLVDKWYGIWQKAKRTKNYDEVEKYLIPGFAKIEFEFPPDTQYPCLPIRHFLYGLLYVIKGETTVPAIEIVQAIDAGAEIKAISSMELPIYYTSRRSEIYPGSRPGIPFLFTQYHLSTLARERKYNQDLFAADRTNARADGMQTLLKEFTNSLYGKFAQGINKKKVKLISTNTKETLGDSKITEVCTAALITSLPRAALSAVLTSIERYNSGKSRKDEISVISATTDGLLIGVPVPENFTACTDYFESVDTVPRLKSKVKHQLPEILKRFGQEGLLDEIEAYLPIRLMRRSRKLLTGSDEILEIKHLADNIYSIKTRGQIGDLSIDPDIPSTVLLAKFNLSPPLSEIYAEDPEHYKKVRETGGVVKNTVESDWIKNCLKRIEEGQDSIETYNLHSLHGFEDIYEKNAGRDLTKKIEERKINADFDWKRKLIWANKPGESEKVSPFSRPHLDQAEMLKYRRIMESIRKRGVVARPQEVLHRIETRGKATYSRGGAARDMTRLFIRGIVQDKISHRALENYEIEAKRLNDIWERLKITEWEQQHTNNAKEKVWNKSDLKNAKKAIWERGCFSQIEMLENLAEELCRTFVADPALTKPLLFGIDRFKEENIELIQYVITAVENAHKDGIHPYDALYSKGLLPGREKIIQTFRGQLSEADIRYWCNASFKPYEKETFRRKNIEKLLSHLDIPINAVPACARVLIKDTDIKKGIPRNKGQAKCVDHFVKALLQPDMRNPDMKDRQIISKLQPYGLTKDRFYLAKKDRFTPHSVSRTPQNVTLITKMARKFKHDPQQFLDILLAKG